MEQQKAIIYCRVSSDRQVKEGHGLESQEQRCLNYAKDKGYIVEKVFRDEGISGALLERPAMKELLKYLENHLINKYVVIIDDLSRFARDVKVHINLKCSIKACNGVLECLNQTIEDSPQGKFVEHIMASYAQMDRELNAKRVQQRMKARMERGYWCLCQPTGMKYKNSEEHGKLLFPVEPISGILKEAIEGYASGRFVSQVDVQTFLQRKHELLNKEKIHLEFVKRILTEITYAGYVEYPLWDVTKRKGHHQGFISIETYNTVQEKLKKPEKQIHITDTVEFPLRRLVVCSSCGKQMTGSRNKGKIKYYSNYTCNNRECLAKPKNIQKFILEEAYLKMLKDIAPQKEVIELTKAIASDSWNKALQDLEKSKVNIEKQVNGKREEINKLLEFIPKASNDTVRLCYEKRIESLSNDIENFKVFNALKKDLHFEVALLEVLDFVGTPWKYWEKTDIEGKHMIHRLIFIEKPAFNIQSGFGTPKVSLPFQLNNQFETREKALVEMPGVEPGCKDQKR